MERDRLSNVTETTVVADTTESSGSEGLQFSDNNCSIAAVTVPSQRDRRTMSRRSGQGGTVYKIGENFVGRYRIDVPGSTERVKKSVIIGSIREMTEPQAYRKLMMLIDKLGVNTPAHLARSQAPVFTFGNAAQNWLLTHLCEKKPSAQRSMRSELNRNILPLLRDTPLDEITFPMVKTLIQQWKKAGLSFKSQKNLFGIVRAVYNYQILCEQQSGKRGTLLPFVIKWKNVQPLEPFATDEPCFEPKQMAAIVQGAKKRQYRALFAVAAGTEIFALRCEDVDLQQGLIHIRRSVFEGIEQTPKNGRGREVPITADVGTILKEHLAGRTFGYVFQSNRGTTLRLGSVLKWGLYPVLDALKIPHCGMHAFRHGRVSYLVYAGVSRAVIRDWIGHSSDAMIDLYTKKLGQFHAVELAKVRPLLDSSWTQANAGQKM
jgi:integrase